MRPQALTIERNKAAQLEQYLTQTEAELDKMTEERDEALAALDAAKLLEGKAIEETRAALTEIDRLRTEMTLADQERAQRKEEMKQKRKRNMNKMMTTIANKMLMATLDNNMKTQGGKGRKRAT